MVSATAVIIDPTGLHLKPAARLSQESQKFRSTVTFMFGNTTANAKSVLSILGSCVKCGDEIEIVCNGPDEEEALSHLLLVIKRGLGSDE